MIKENMLLVGLIDRKKDKEEKYLSFQHELLRAYTKMVDVRTEKKMQGTMDLEKENN